MKKYKILVIFLVVLLLICAFSACKGGKSKKNEIVDPVDLLSGKWVEIKEDGEEGDVYIFGRNGKGTIQSDDLTADMTWSAEGELITVTISLCGQSETSEFRYIISGNEMTLTETDEENSTTIKLKKIGNSEE